MKKASQKTILELTDIASSLSQLGSRLGRVIHKVQSATVRGSLRNIELDCMGHAAFLARIRMLNEDNGN